MARLRSAGFHHARHEDADGKPICSPGEPGRDFDIYLTNGIHPMRQIGFMPSAFNSIRSLINTIGKQVTSMATSKLAGLIR